MACLRSSTRQWHLGRVLGHDRPLPATGIAATLGVTDARCFGPSAGHVVTVLTGVRQMLHPSLVLSRRRLLGAGVLMGSVALTGCSTASSPRRSTDGWVAWPADDLWPDGFGQAPAEVQEAYRYAVVNRDALQWMPCFCGCGADGHRSNFDCYVRELRDDGSVVLDSMSFG